MATGKGRSFDSSNMSSRKNAAMKSHVVSKHEGTDDDSVHLLQHIFGPLSDEGAVAGATAGSSFGDKELGLENLGTFIECSLTEAAQHPSVTESCNENEAAIGRLGAETVVFDTSGNYGTLVIEADRLGVASHSNFSTIRANTCVFKGKWVYELMLGSKGVMQLGWSTVNCNFSQEEGVGDTADSYAYDGNRLRKWNVRTVKYGEAWLTGDVISCAIDCEKGTVTFCRNGHNMGEAFRNIKLGQGIAYFPAVSLSLGENLRANFGATPLRYPIDGYRPLQDPPTVDLVKAQRLFVYLERLLPTVVKHHQMLESSPEKVPASPPSSSEHRSHNASLMLTTAHIFEKLAPLLRNSYIVEACLFRFLLKFCDSKQAMKEQPHVLKTLDFIWSFMQDDEIKSCMEHLVVSLLSSYRFSPVTAKFSYQHMYLTLTLAILRHEVTRKYLLKNVLFDKVKFPIFLHVKPPDDAGLMELIPTVWWPLKQEAEEGVEPEVTEEERPRRESYKASCDQLHRRVAGLEQIQVEILKVLLNDKDKTKTPSSRFIFLHKFREFLRENAAMTQRGHFVNQCPLPVSLCFLHRLIQAVRFYWDEYASQNTDKAVPSSQAYVPVRRFYDDSINYFEVQRLGGLYSHLKKTYKEEVHIAMTSSEGNNEHKGPFDSLLQRLSMVGDSPKKVTNANPDTVENGTVCSASLIELLDGIILLYNIAAHKQLSKMCSLRENLVEYVKALDDTEKKIAQCPSELDSVKAELERARQVFLEKTSEQVRHMAWVIAVIYAKDKQDDVCWLLSTVLRTIENASKANNKLFSFVPDFYAEVAINSYNAIRSYFHPTMPYHLLPEFPHILVRFAQFLSDHFADPRIVHADVKDSLVQSLACFVCYRMSLQALENVSPSSRLGLIKALLSPYENRSWAQTNWILVRLWKGCGFGFRYKHLPHLLPAKNQQQEIGNASLQKPCPSLVYQDEIAEYLRQDEEPATKLLDTILNQLNWAFSEFVGMLQELQQLSLRPMASIVDSRHLKICATCFDISVGLLRVLEMIVSLVPELLTDWTRPSAELLICRLFQLLTQVLNRVTSRSNMFDMVVSVNVPGLETVDHFPILTAVAGIIIRLIMEGTDKSRECATTSILAEPGFQLSALEFLLGGPDDDDQSAGATAPKKDFSFRNYSEVNALEITQIEELINHLRQEETRSRLASPEIDEDALCAICYARPNSAIFKPCGHNSCKACISHHLMNKKECFFCKAEVKSVADLTTGKPLQQH